METSVVDRVREYVRSFGAKKAALLLLALYVAKETIGRKLYWKLKNRPPGPMPFPILGSFPYLSEPNKFPGIHVSFWELAKKWGPVYSLYMGSHYSICLNSREAFYEALMSKQDEFANRPVLKSFEAMTHGAGVAMNNGHRWRMIRTVLQQRVTNKQKGVEAEELIKAEIGSSLCWLRGLCEKGRSKDYDFRQLCRRESLNVICQKIFSFRFGDANTPFYYEFQDWIRIIFEHMAQGSPSDFMPIFSIFGDSKEAKEYFATCIKMENFIDDEIARHRKELPSKPKEKYDFIDNMLQATAEAKAKGEETLSDVDIRVVAWDAVAGGIDTSATTMEWMIYILINHPEVKAKLQRELDEFVGPDRLPALSDVDNLQYLKAFIDEIFRWKHFAPQGLPHEAACDTTILGYDIPKGTQVFLNYHSLHMNPENWKNPEQFRPERFLEEDRELLDVCLHPERFFTDKNSYKFVPFGQGRRRCVGYGLGRIVLWLKTAMWLHCFDWQSPDGKPMDITTEYLGITLVPVSQKVKAIPRPASRLLISLEGKLEIDTR